MTSKSKFLTRKELEKLIDERHESVKLVQKKKTVHSSQLWEHFHQVLVNNEQQQFVSCNDCKMLLAFQSMNGTNNLKSHLKSCTKPKLKIDDLNQTTVHDFYSSEKKIKIPGKVKSAVLEAAAEFSALDGRAFETISGAGFQNLAQVLFDAGRLCNNSSIQIKDILPHPTTVRKIIILKTFTIILNLAIYNCRSVELLHEFMNSRRNN
jgi:hypothetical protein